MRADSSKNEGLKAADHPCGEVSGNETLEAYLRGLMEKYNTDERQLTIKTGMDQGVVYRALRGLRKPGRNQLILMALALGCDVDEAKKLVRVGGRDALIDHYKRDAVILFCIERKLTIDECQAILEKFQLKLLRE